MALICGPNVTATLLSKKNGVKAVQKYAKPQSPLDKFVAEVPLSATIAKQKRQFSNFEDGKSLF